MKFKVRIDYPQHSQRDGGFYHAVADIKPFDAVSSAAAMQFIVGHVGRKRWWEHNRDDEPLTVAVYRVDDESGPS